MEKSYRGYGKKFILKNVTIKNATFINFNASYSKFRNVIFINCHFIKVSFYQSEFENVSFIGGSIGYKGDPEIDENLTTFEYSNFLGKIVFDNVRFEKVYMYAIGTNNTKTDVIFKNMHKINNEDIITITGDGINLRIDNCFHKGFLFASLGQNSTIYATNSTFIGSGFGSQSKILYIENCELLDDASLGDSEVIVIKDSVALGSGMGPYTKEAYFVNNTYPYIWTFIS
jgi:hypothetical protein